MSSYMGRPYLLALLALGVLLCALLPVVHAQAYWDHERDCPTLCDASCECVSQDALCRQSCGSCLVQGVPCGVNLMRQQQRQPATGTQEPVFQQIKQTIVQPPKDKKPQPNTKPKASMKQQQKKQQKDKHNKKTKKSVKLKQKSKPATASVASQKNDVSKKQLTEQLHQIVSLQQELLKLIAVEHQNSRKDSTRTPSVPGKRSQQDLIRALAESAASRRLHYHLGTHRALAMQREAAQRSMMLDHIVGNLEGLVNWVGQQRMTGRLGGPYLQQVDAVVQKAVEFAQASEQRRRSASFRFREVPAPSSFASTQHDLTNEEFDSTQPALVQMPYL